MSIFPYDEEAAAGFVENMVEGARMAHRLVRPERHHVLLREDFCRKNRKWQLSRAGEGHEPAHAGFVGPGTLTAVCGGICVAHNSGRRHHIHRHGDAGCLLIVKNYTGDRLNGCAAERAKRRDSMYAWLLLEMTQRSTITLLLAAGAWRERYLCIKLQVGGRCWKVIDHGIRGFKHRKSVASMGVALTMHRSWLEQSDRLAADVMEVGLGIHGEPAQARRNDNP